MLLTKAEFAAAMRDEVRILLHLAEKIEPATWDYRPTPQQRSTGDLIKYLSMMGPAILRAAKTGAFDEAGWVAAEQAAGAGTVEQAVAAIAGQIDIYDAILRDVTDAELRAEVDLFGEKSTRGAFLAKWLLAGSAAYRMQLFLYLKAAGQPGLGTMNLWAGVDAPPAA